MQTKCSFCGLIQDAPDIYEDKEIKCTSCQKKFVAKKHTPPKPKPAPDLPKKIIQTPTPPTGPIYDGLGTILVGVLMIVIGFFAIAVPKDPTAGAVTMVGGVICCGLGNMLNNFERFFRYFKYFKTKEDNEKKP